MYCFGQRGAIGGFVAATVVLNLAAIVFTHSAVVFVDVLFFSSVLALAALAVLVVMAVCIMLLL